MKTLVFIAVFFAGVAYTYSDSKFILTEKENAIHLLIYDERNLDALKIFTNEVGKSTKQKDDKETADNIYWIAECLFQLKKTTFFDTLLKYCGPFVNKYNTDAYVRLMTLEAKCLIEKGNYNDCISLLSKLSGKTKDKTVFCEIQLTMADANQRMQLVQNSHEYYQYVIKNATDTIQIARAYNGLGSYYCILSKLDSAKICYDIAYNKFYTHLGEEHSRTAQVHYNLGLVADRNFDLYVAEQHFLNALSIYQKRLGDLHPGTANSYGALGSLYLMKDDPGKALYYSVKERDILLQLHGKESPDLAYSYLNCGKIYFLLNENKLSEQQLNLALELVKKYFGVKHNLYSQCIVELSKTYTAQHQFKKAEKILSEAIQLKENNPDDYLADIYQQSGENYLQQRQFEKALLQFKKANNLYVQYFGNKNIFSIDPLLGTSDVYLKQQKPYDAYTITNLALSLTKEKKQIIYPYDHWLCMVQLLKCKKLLYENNLQPYQNCKNDIELIKATLQKANQIKNTLYSTGSQLYYAEKMAELNQLGIYFLTHFYKKTDDYFLDNLLLFAENNKSNLLRNKIINYKTEGVLPISEKIKSALIRGRLNYFISLYETEEDINFNINDSVLFYQNKYELFTKSIEKKYQKIYALKYTENPLTILQIQQKLANNFTLLEYCNDNENYYCIAISKSSITYKICGKISKIDSLIILNQSAIISKHFNASVSQELYKYLLPNSMLKNLIIAADERIYEVAFDALTSSQNLDYLIYNHTSQYAFSANTYFNPQPIVDNKKIIAFYPDFTNSTYAVLNNKKEHQVLKSFSDYNVYYKQNALKNNFITKCNTSGILHIASHLITDTISPLKSYLVFQPDNNNYSLSINEIWRLNINCQLITLASCQSNFGKLENGEGIQNFAWAFHYAGARNILSTQWNASDKSTSVIVSDFYKNLRNGKNKQEAIQIAKINYLQHTDAIGIQPFFWSNFYLYGDENPVNISPNFLVKLWWMPVLLLILCFFAIAAYNRLYRKKQYDHL